jgi:hypothetical protein
VKLLTFRALTTLRKRFGAPLPDGSARHAVGTDGPAQRNGPPILPPGHAEGRA